MGILCEKCDANNDPEIDSYYNGVVENNLTSYTYTAKFTCWRCKHENDVTIDTISSDEIEEVLDSQIRYN
ncbi:hypothetical protein MX054_004251 [Enterobacter cloacae]|uniref:hypothetical protein n=1 Tax=Enterobacter bugandensis TaxID=881260 RepID=UPI0020056486|nr:hypothetical protein [Enterobacter bugandensis]EJC0567391.1 hypothetical protein [Enterobacter cloacae]MCK6898280.1 hypothetical protein [Enterobacter bugandensis]